MVTCTYDTVFMLHSQHFVGLESAMFWLNEGIIKLPKGMVGIYHAMAKRGQYFAHLLDRLRLTPAEMDAHLLSNSISDEAHAALLTAHGAAVAARPNPQSALFDEQMAA